MHLQWAKNLSAGRSLTLRPIRQDIKENHNLFNHGFVFHIQSPLKCFSWNGAITTTITIDWPIDDICAFAILNIIISTENWT